MIETILCPWEQSSYLLFSSNVPQLVYYSHGVAALTAITIGLLVYLNNKSNIIAQLFLVFVSLFTIWTIFDVILWATNQPTVVMFIWSLMILIESVIFALAFYICYRFIYHKNTPLSIDILVLLLLFPFLIFLPTNLNLEGLLLSSCESIEGPLAIYYSYFINGIFVLAILFVAIKQIPRINDQNKKAASWFFVFGLITFLTAFIFGNIAGSITEDWEIGQWGLIGMPIFATILGYSIIKFQTFRAKVVATEMLVVILWMLVGSLLLVVRSDSSRIITVLTLLFTIIAGFFLIKSVRNEIHQREEIEKLAQNLKRANERLRELDKMKSEFVSIASHQLRSPITSIRGFASMMVEGSFGKLPPKALEATEHIAETSKSMAMSIEDYLNVSRIESGNMIYNLVDFNLRNEVERIVDDVRAGALKQSVLITFKSELDKQGIVHADQGKTQQILHNLLNNALKYTPKGTVNVLVHDNVATKEIYVDITDTGIGMSAETLNKLFAKFTRATNAHKTNVHGTGLGLFIARVMAQKMGGDITASSPGEGQGSTFRLTLPFVL